MRRYFNGKNFATINDKNEDKGIDNAVNCP
jgi:hypothetical protein